MALEPGAWEGESKPARLDTHQDYVTLPFSNKQLRQKQDPAELKIHYEGVHLTPTQLTALVYGNIKATENDPPVVIGVDPTGLQRYPDVDTNQDAALDVYVDGRRNDWTQIIESSQETEEAADLLLGTLRDDNDMWEDYSEANDVFSLMADRDKSPPPYAIDDFCGNMTDDEIVQLFQELIAGNPPHALQVAVTHQFRIMKPIQAERVRAIFLAPWCNFNAELGGTDYIDDRILEEKGWHKEGEDIIDEEGRIVLSSDDVEYEWVLDRLKPLYMDQNEPLKGMEEFFSDDVVWHGTSLSRATQAFPELLQ